MTYYFDPENADDLKLLKESVRDSAELTNVANATEDKVRLLYTEFVRGEYEVKLRGYLENADPDNEYALFKRAYKQTIADCISFVLENYSLFRGLKREKRGQREEQYFEGSNNPSLPSGLFYRLTVFDTKEPLYY